jgi:hypothetical protein
MDVARLKPPHLGPSKSRKRKVRKVRTLKDRLLDQVGVEPRSYVPLACSDIHKCAQAGGQ